MPPLVLETGNLSAAQARKLQELVTGAGFFALPTEMTPERIDPDALCYALTIHAEEQGEHTVSFTASSLQGPLQELVSTIRSFARKPPEG
jgi:hypothetical protein